MITINACFAALSLVATAFSTPAMADESPAQNKIVANDPDDRIASVPTNWWTYSHQSLQDISNTVSSKNARIIDISIEQLAPSPTFTTTYVENSGQYYKAWAWSAGIDAAGLSSALATNNGRLEVLKAYDAGGGQIRFIAVMIVNSGKDFKTWTYNTDISPDQITAALAASNGRLVQLSYVSGGKTHYAAVGGGAGPQRSQYVVVHRPAGLADQFAPRLQQRPADRSRLQFRRRQLQRHHGRLLGRLSGIVVLHRPDAEPDAESDLPVRRKDHR
jgi:hypothetical protein